MFFFDSKTAKPIVPLLSAALYFWKAYNDRMSFGYVEGKNNYTDPKHGPRSVVILTAIFYQRLQFVSFFVYRRKSWDRLELETPLFLCFCAHRFMSLAQNKFNGQTINKKKYQN